jgi:hypothetical protein
LKKNNNLNEREREIKSKMKVAIVFLMSLSLALAASSQSEREKTSERASEESAKPSERGADWTNKGISEQLSERSVVPGSKSSL